MVSKRKEKLLEWLQQSCVWLHTIRTNAENAQKLTFVMKWLIKKKNVVANESYGMTCKMLSLYMI